MKRKTDFNQFFELQFLSAKQNEFDRWFASMASCVFGPDFEKIKPGGAHGDKKSDGRRISTETIYQCYAPDSPTTFASNAAKKIADSFPDVLTYWPNIKEWIFVHNNEDGLSTSASDKIEELRQKHPQVTIQTGSRRFLKDEFHDKLTMAQLIDLYPKASLNIEGVRMEHVRPLLKRIIAERRDQLGSMDFGAIPDEQKMEFNELGHVDKFRTHSLAATM